MSIAHIRYSLSGASRDCLKNAAEGRGRRARSGKRAHVLPSRTRPAIQRAMRIVVAVLCLISTVVAAPLAAADKLDPTPRIAVISAFEPEWKALKASVGEPKSYSVNGV